MSKRLFAVAIVCIAAALPAANAGDRSDRISGDYLEMRSCAVFTGPCFANAEVGVTGREGIMAWNIEQGVHKGVDLAGLKVVVAVAAADTLGFGAGVVIHPDPIKSVILADEKASPQQREALVDFAKARAGKLAGNVVKVHYVSIDMKLDHVDMVGQLKAGDQVALSTRKLKKGDCVCSNEVIFYPPLAAVDNSAPAYTLEGRYSGRDLGVKWSEPNTRSAFLATFTY
jgi:hypothetical protein